MTKQVKFMFPKEMVKSITALALIIIGSTVNATIVENVPEWDNPPKIPESPVPNDLPNEIPDAFKDYLCDQYPIEKAYPYLVQDGYVLIHEADFVEIITDYDILGACLEHEKEK